MSVTSQQVTKTPTTKSVGPVLGAKAQMRGLAGNHTLIGGHFLQRKCACGGQGGKCACKKPDEGMLQRAVQTKLAVNEAGDRYEQEADRVANQVLAAPSYNAVERTAPRIQRFTGNSARSTVTAPSSVDRVLSSPGRPLDSTLQRNMEHSFGYDFSRVRVHSGSTAAQSARDVNAHAYTVGHDIVFGAGRFAPATHQGQRLIAHELTHVVQQSGSNRVGVNRVQGGQLKPTIQRMKIGTDPVTKTVKSDTGGRTEDVTLKPPPSNHLGRLNAAIERVRRVAEDPNTYSNCHDLFKKHCRGCDAEGLTTMSEVFKKAVIRFDESDVTGGAWSLNCDPDIAYSQGGYDEGTNELAGTIVHEMGHVCGIEGSDHALADRIALGCITGASTVLSARGWHDPTAVIIGFRRILKNIAGGQLALRAGLDLDAAALKTDIPAQVGSVMGRFEARKPWWGAEKWGGVSLFAELGAGVGRFRVREPAAGDPEFTYRGGLILSLGAKLEFFNPFTGKEGRETPMALTAGYQWMIPLIPLTPEAEKLHGVLIGLEIGL